MAALVGMICIAAHIRYVPQNTADLVLRDRHANASADGPIGRSRSL